MPEKRSTEKQSEHSIQMSDDLRHLKEALQRSYTERFLFATRLYKIGKMLEGAQVTHQTDNLIKKD